MKSVQPCILAPVPRVARHLTFALKPDSQPREALHALARLFDQNAVHGDVGIVLVLGIFVASPVLAFFLARKTWRGEMAKWMLATLWVVALISLAVVLSTRGLPFHNNEARPVTALAVLAEACPGR